MRSRTHLFLAAALVLAVVFDASGATPREELEALRDSAQGLLDGGELDAAQAKAAGKIVAAADKAMLSAGEDDAKLLKKIPGVAKKVEKGAKKGLDLSAPLAALDAAVGDSAALTLAQARELGGVLTIEKHATKVLALAGKGEAQLAKADPLPVGAKRMKKLVAGVKKLAKAREKGDAWFQQEIDDGDLALVVEEVLLDGSELVAGTQITQVEHELRIRVNLPLYAGSVSAEAVVLERNEGESFPLRLTGAPLEGEKVMTLAIDPLEPGQYDLVIRGLDDASGQHLVGARLVPLATTIRIPITVVE